MKTYFCPLFWTFGIEIDFGWYDSDNLFDLSCSVRLKGDHPGFYFSLLLWKAQFELNIASSEHDVTCLVDVKKRAVDDKTLSNS